MANPLEIVVPYGGNINWNDFYSGLYPQAAIDQKRLLTSDSPVANPMSFEGLQNLFGGNGGESDTPILDALKPDAQAGTLGGSGGGGFDLEAMLGGVVARIAIIILGFIFVAAGLAMFKND